jgi:hypothetical protein
MDNRAAKRFAAQIAFDLLDSVTEGYLDYQMRHWQRRNEEYLTPKEKERIMVGLEDIKAQLKRKTTKSTYEHHAKDED